MSELGDDFRAMREETKRHRAKMLEKADTSGWTAHTDYHFSRDFNGERVEWWPSGGKAKYKGKMVYGHKKVNDLIKRLKGGRGMSEYTREMEQERQINIWYQLAVGESVVLQDQRRLSRVIGGWVLTEYVKGAGDVTLALTSVFIPAIPKNIATVFIG